MRNWRKRASVRLKDSTDSAVWQKGYFERVLRGEEGTDAVIAYMLNNPVRAGLVETPMAYPHSWSVATHEHGPEEGI